MNASQKKTHQRNRRRARIRSRVSGTALKPRISVYKSNRYLHAQLIDDTTGTTLCALNGKTVLTAFDKKKPPTKVEQARALGVAFSEVAKKRQVETVVFDRGGYEYRGRIAAFAHAVREGGLIF
jgi:large subunit ribosomal protein L18